jgi:glycosyltransferase involved in cell wall biosynthesis
MPLDIDGVEIDAEAAGLACERGVKCAVGTSDDLDDLSFDGKIGGLQSYDAVTAFEVLEHVPDVDAFLSQLEAMVRPGGRVYLSTPNGCFGAGANPNHLRALRAIDVADILRRRGTLRDMEVGDDGVVVASYTPLLKRGDVAIFCGPCWAPWAPADIETTGLGGSETAAIRLAQELSELGWVVTVYGEIEPATVFRDVIYKHWRAFDPMEPRDCVIASRVPQIFDRPIKARRKLLWLHDTDVGPELTERRLERIDAILTLSGWHERHVKGLYPFAASKVTRVRNGIHAPYFTRPTEAPERAKRVVYTSSPDRGLDLLLELWPRVREQVPDAELWFSYAPVYFEIAKTDAVVGAHAKRIEKLSKQDGVIALGSYPQPEVAKLMMDSLVWCAPSWNTPNDMPFCETSCIGAMEAMAGGCLVVASNWGALTETVAGRPARQRRPALARVARRVRARDRRRAHEPGDAGVGAVGRARAREAVGLGGRGDERGGDDRPRRAGRGSMTLEQSRSLVAGLGVSLIAVGSRLLIAWAAVRPSNR